MRRLRVPSAAQSLSLRSPEAGHGFNFLRKNAIERLVWSIE